MSVPSLTPLPSTMSAPRTVSKQRSASIVVVGLNEVGLALLVHLLQNGIDAIGFDLDPYRIQDISKGIFQVHDIVLKTILETQLCRVTSDLQRVLGANVFYICTKAPYKFDSYLSYDTKRIGGFIRYLIDERNVRESTKTKSMPTQDHHQPQSPWLTSSSPSSSTVSPMSSSESKQSSSTSMSTSTTSSDGSSAFGCGKRQTLCICSTIYLGYISYVLESTYGDYLKAHNMDLCYMPLHHEHASVYRDMCNYNSLFIGSLRFADKHRTTKHVAPILQHMESIQHHGAPLVMGLLEAELCMLSMAAYNQVNRWMKKIIQRLCAQHNLKHGAIFKVMGVKAVDEQHVNKMERAQLLTFKVLLEKSKIKSAFLDALLDYDSDHVAFRVSNHKTQYERDVKAGKPVEKRVTLGKVGERCAFNCIDQSLKLAEAEEFRRNDWSVLIQDKARVLSAIKLEYGALFDYQATDEL